MSTLHSTAIKEFKENDRVLSDLEKQKIIDIGDEYKSLWNELSANLQKWLFATLITVNLGGMAFAINSQIHPVAVEYAVKSFFGGLAAALLAGLLELFRIRRMQDIVYQLKNGIFENGIIHYRIFTYGGAATPVPVVEGAAIPTVTRSALGLATDARLVSSSLDGDRVALTFEDGAGSTIIVFDTGRMAVVSRLRVADE